MTASATVGRHSTSPGLSRKEGVVARVSWHSCLVGGEMNKTHMLFKKVNSWDKRRCLFGVESQQRTVGPALSREEATRLLSPPPGLADNGVSWPTAP